VFEEERERLAERKKTWGEGIYVVDVGVGIFIILTHGFFLNSFFAS